MTRSILIFAAVFAGTVFIASAADDKQPARKSRRQKSTTRVITNEDVKRAKGKVIDLPAAANDSAGPEATLAERHAALQVARGAATERLHAAESVVAALEKELARLERAYFEEDDLDVRDTVIAKQFERARQKAAAAATELETARKELAELPANAVDRTH